MLARLCQVLGYDLPGGGSLPADAGQCASWALDSIQTVTAAGLMSGVGDGKFAPTAPYTYEQSALTMVAVYDLLTGGTV